MKCQDAVSVAFIERSPSARNTFLNMGFRFRGHRLGIYSAASLGAAQCRAPATGEAPPRAPREECVDSDPFARSPQKRKRDA